MNICIVGASRGLGDALSWRFIQDGHTVWGIGRSAEDLRSVQKFCGPAFQWTKADITDRDSLVYWKECMKKANFSPDVIILNASVQLDDMKDGYDAALGSTVLRTNLEGSLDCLGLFLDDFLKRRRGRFVAIASTAALRPSIRSASYAASKAGLAMAFRTFRLRYPKSGVTFGTVVLGPIWTQMWEGNESPLVPSVATTAKDIAPFAYGTKSVLYYPVLTVLFLRLSLFLPDWLFASLSTTFLKK